MSPFSGGMLVLIGEKGERRTIAVSCPPMTDDITPKGLASERSAHHSHQTISGQDNNRACEGVFVLSVSAECKYYKQRTETQHHTHSAASDGHKQ